MSCLKHLSVLPDLSRSSFLEIDIGDLKVFFTIFCFLFDYCCDAKLNIVLSKYKHLLKIWLRLLKSSKVKKLNLLKYFTQEIV